MRCVCSDVPAQVWRGSEAARRGGEEVGPKHRHPLPDAPQKFLRRAVQGPAGASYATIANCTCKTSCCCFLDLHQEDFFLTTLCAVHLQDERRMLLNKRLDLDIAHSRLRKAHEADQEARVSALGEEQRLLEWTDAFKGP